MLVLLLLAPRVPGQVQSKLDVRAFGGERQSLPSIKVPPELKSFVPDGFVLRAVLRPNAIVGGDTFILYDNGEDIFPEVHLHAIRQGIDTKLFDESIAGVAGVFPIRAGKGKQLLAFAYHQGFDGADTRFMIFGLEKGRYKVIFEGETTTGQMRILGQSPLTIELWSAAWNLVDGESCVWCPHRYRIRTYALRSGKFLLEREQISKAPLDPAEVAEKTFLIGRSKP